jgi:hypothetical protein
MHAPRFDALVRSLLRGSRRDHMRWLLGSAFAGTLVPLRSALIDAKKKKPKKKKKKPRTDECANACPAGFFCCAVGEPFCCPTRGLPVCCPFGCCPDDPRIGCGPTPDLPCVDNFA